MSFKALRAVDAIPRPTLFYRFIATASRPIVKKVYRLRVSGLEHVPAQGGFVVAANHTSNLDPWPLGIALWPRPLHFMAKHEGLEAAAQVADRGGRIVRGATRGRRRAGARDGDPSLPRGSGNGDVPGGNAALEGLRKKHEPRPHSDAARIALGAGVPLIPAAMRGLERLSRLGPLRLGFGAAIPLEDLKDLDSHAAAEEATRRLWAEIERLEAELDAEG